MAMNAGQAAVKTAFQAEHPPGSKPAPSLDDFTALVLAIDKARGNAVVMSIQSIASCVSPLAIVAAVDSAAGQAVYVDPVSGQLKLASAASLASSMVLGLAQSSTLATFAAPISTVTLTLQDWTATVGTALLAKGARYFLGVAPGTLMLGAPATPGQSVVSVGIALSTTQFEIAPTPPILL
jgi:hypothetical protein